MPVGAALGAATVGSSLIGAGAAKKAGKQEAAAANRAADLQQQIFNTVRSDLSPFVASGGAANNALLQAMGLGGASYAPSASVGGADVPIGGSAPANPTSGMRWIDTSGSFPVLRVYDESSGRWGVPSAEEQQTWLGGNSLGDVLTGAQQEANPLESPLLKPFSMTQAELAATPGYQFALSQGLKAVRNALGARGLGSQSGALVKGAASFATGLADQTFNTQANNYYTGQQNAFNRLLGLTQTGAGAAGQSGQLGVQSGSNIGNALIGAGQAQAGGTVGAANALAGGLGNIGNLVLTNQLLKGGGYGGIFSGSPNTLYTPTAVGGGWGGV